MQEQSTPQKRGNWASNDAQEHNPYQKTHTNQINPLLYSLSDATDHHRDTYDNIQEFTNEQYATANNGDHSYYLNFADDKSLMQQSQEMRVVPPEYESTHQHEIEDIFAYNNSNNQLQQQTSIFQNVSGEDTSKSKSQRMKELLKDFQKRKDQVINEQIMSRVNSSQCCEQHGPLMLTIEDDNNKTNYHVGDYKRACTTCKMMKEGLAQLAHKAEVVKKPSQKIVKKPSLPVQHQKTPSNRYDPAPSNHRIEHKPTVSVDAQNYEELLRVIKQLEEQNQELKGQLRDALVKLQMKVPDVVVQYQNEVLIAQQKFQALEGEMRQVQQSMKPLHNIQQEMTRLQKTVVDKQVKGKLQELGVKVNGVVTSVMAKMGELVEHNSKERYLEEVRAKGGKDMLKEEEKKWEQKVLVLQESVREEWERERERWESEVVDKEEMIKELKESKRQLKREVEKRDIEINEGGKKIKQLERVVNEKDKEMVNKEIHDGKVMALEQELESKEVKIKVLNEKLEVVEKEKQELRVLAEQSLIRQESNGQENIKLLLLKQQALESQASIHQQQLSISQEELSAQKQKFDQLTQEKAELINQYDILRKEHDKITESNKELRKNHETLESINRQMVQDQQDKDRLYSQKDKNLKLLQDQLDQLEDSNRMLEKSKKKLEVELGISRQTKDKILEDKSHLEVELHTTKDEVTQLISDRVAAEQKLQDTKAVLQRVEGMLKDKQEFGTLEELVNQVQSVIVFKSQATFSETEKQIIRDLFPAIPLDQPEDSELKEESNRLYFELRNEYDSKLDLLRKQRDYLKQLQDFSKAILSLDDRAVESNFVCTQQKRNKAPMYQNCEQLLQDVQAKIEALEAKQKGMDRLSMTKGIEKYDDAFKSRKGSVKSAMHSLKKVKTSTKELVAPLQFQAQEDFLNKSTNQQLHSHTLKPPVDKRKRSAMNSSDLGHMFLKDAVADPEFIDELMSNQHNDLSLNEGLGSKHKKLKLQITDMLSTNRGQSSASKRNGHSRQQRLLLGVTTLSARNKLNPKMITVENINETESGIHFFQDQEDIANASFEVKVENEHDIKGELLQFIHCQAMMIEDKQDMFKIND